jgi:hypothetical protein
MNFRFKNLIVMLSILIALTSNFYSQSIQEVSPPERSNGYKKYIEILDDFSRIEILFNENCKILILTYVTRYDLFNKEKCLYLLNGRVIKYLIRYNYIRYKEFKRDSQSEIYDTIKYNKFIYFME